MENYNLFGTTAYSLTCSPCLDHPAGDFPGVEAQGGDATSEPFISDIGALFPIALWGRTLL